MKSQAHSEDLSVVDFGLILQYSVIDSCEGIKGQHHPDGPFISFCLCCLVTPRLGFSKARQDSTGKFSPLHSDVATRKLAAGEMVKRGKGFTQSSVAGAFK